jgi:hypothetical protein
MTQLRRDVVRHSIRNRNLTVLAQALVNRDPHALKASKEIKQAAFASMMGS